MGYMVSNLLSLKICIKEWLIENPSDAPQILKYVSEGLENYEQSVLLKRNHLAVSAIDNLISLLSNYGKSKKLTWRVLKDNDKATWLVDAIVHNFPKGFNTNMSQNGKKMLKLFCELYFVKSNNFRSCWEKEIKGNSKYMEMLYTQYIDLSL